MYEWKLFGQKLLLNPCKLLTSQEQSNRDSWVWITIAGANHFNIITKAQQPRIIIDWSEERLFSALD